MKLEIFNAGEPMDRDATEFRVICPKADVAPKKTSVTAKTCLGFIGFPGGADAGCAPIEDTKRGTARECPGVLVMGHRQAGKGRKGWFVTL